MKIFLTVFAVILVLVIGFVTLVIANEGEDKVVGEYLAQNSPSPSISAAPSIEPSVSPSPSPSVDPTPYSGPTNPLTGLPTETEILNNRPYAIMINNIRVAQPQLGISKADIIYEILVEGGITRMMAVFQDVTNADVIGSIRSARPYFVDIALGLDAIYIHAGGSPDAYTEFVSTAIYHLDGVNGKKQDIFFRDKNRLKTMDFEHTLVTTAEKILKYLPTYGVNLEHKSSYTTNMTFSDNVTMAGELKAESIKAHFSSSKTTTFEYSAEDDLYAVSQYGTAYIDGNDKTQLSVKNLLILRTNINVISGDDKGRIDVDTTGSGTGTFYCGGKYVDIKWSRAKNSSQFIFTLVDGTELVFGRGKTYICIISNKDMIDIT